METCNKKGKIGGIVIVVIVVVFILFVILFRTFIAPIINAKTDARNSQTSPSSSSSSTVSMVGGSSSSKTSSENDKLVVSYPTNSFNLSGKVGQEGKINFTFTNHSQLYIAGCKLITTGIKKNDLVVKDISDNGQYSTGLVQQIVWTQSIAPGKDGSLSFTLVPSKAGNYSVLFTLDNVTNDEVYDEKGNLAQFEVNFTVTP